jgi:hypothetical protein
MKNPKKFILVFAIVMAFISGCTGSNRQTNPSTQATFPSSSISIIIPVQPDKFSKQAVVQVDLLNSGQIAIADANPICEMMGNGPGGISTHCPPGTEYKEVKPEEFTFPIGEIGNQIELTSTHLKLGEQFRITVSGLSADDCNGRSTRYTGVANADKITLTHLSWATTTMACVKTT